MSMAFSLKNAKILDKMVWFKLFKRTMILLFLGIFFDVMALDFVGIKKARIPGVLQRIAFCNFVVAILVIFGGVVENSPKKTSTNHLDPEKQILLSQNNNDEVNIVSINQTKEDQPKNSFCLWFAPTCQRAIIVGLVAIYLSLMLFLNVPPYTDPTGVLYQCGVGVLSPQCNAGAYIDRKIFDTNMIHPNDPEGFLSSFTAIATTFLGFEFGRILVTPILKGRHYQILKRWGVLSLLLVISSAIIQIWLPYNKKIWSLSFALVTGGICGITLCACYLILDVAEWRDNKFLKKIISPLLWLGSNPLAIFVLMILLEVILLDNIKVNNFDPSNGRGDKISLWLFLTLKCFETWMNPILASLIVSFIHLLLWVLIAGWMYWKKIFIKL